MAEHTEGYVIQDQVAANTIDIVSKRSGLAVAQVMSEEDKLGDLEIANAERIVKCWNCHDDLLAACKMALDHATCQDEIEMLTTAIAKAG